MKIAILTPTRGRVWGLERLYNSIKNTISGNNQIEFIYYVDNDDTDLINYASLKLIKDKNIRVVFVNGQRNPLCKTWNLLVNYSNADWYMCGNDDFIFNTKNWDLILENKIKTALHPYFMYFFDDGIQGMNHAAFPIVSKEWINAIGYYFPEKFIHNYPDTWVNDIALIAGVRVYVSEVKTSHLHYSEGLSEYDKTYSDGMDGNSNEIDKSIYIQTAQERINLGNLIKEKIKLWNYSR